MIGQLLTLEGMACYAGLLLAPAEGFEQGFLSKENELIHKKQEKNQILVCKEKNAFSVVLLF